MKYKNILLFNFFICFTLLTKAQENTSKFSLESYSPIVGDQSHYTNVIGWSLAYYNMTIQENFKKQNKINVKGGKKKTERSFELKSTHDFVAYSPFYNHNQLANDPHSGVLLEKFIENLKKEGVCVINDFDKPYETPTNDLKTFLRKNKRLKKVKRIWLNNIRDFAQQDIVNQVKKNLKKGRSTTFVIEIGEEFKAINNSAIYNQLSFNSLEGRHLITVVGYDESGSTPFFRAVNSWSIEWGDKGYVNISYDTLFKMSTEYITLKI